MSDELIGMIDIKRTSLDVMRRELLPQFCGSPALPRGVRRLGCLRRA
jgi:hypothetical protein